MNELDIGRSAAVMATVVDLKAMSISEEELVLPYAHVIEVLGLLESQAVPLLGWEGWLRFPDGRLGHSSKHQGTDTLGLDSVTAYRWARDTIRASQQEHECLPEMPETELLFCITLDD
jgi:hypothetical protein